MRSHDGINDIYKTLLFFYYWQKFCYISLNLKIREKKTIKYLTVLTDKKNTKMNYLLFIYFIYY